MTARSDGIGQPNTPQRTKDRAVTDHAHDTAQNVVRCRQAQRKIWPHLAQELARMHGNKMWKQLGYDSWREYLAQPEIAISQSTASKLIRVYRHYTQSGANVEDLQTHSWPKLYEAIDAGWNLEQTFANAHLPMTEIKALKEGPDSPEPPKCVCSTCGNVHRPRAAVSGSKPEQMKDGG